MSEGVRLGHEEWVRRYQHHLETKTKEVSDIDSDLWKKILFIVLLESLALVRHGGEGPRKRFRSLLDSSSDWDDRARVSLPQLLYRMEREALWKSSHLAHRLRKEIATWRLGTVYAVAARDSLAAEVEQWDEVKELGPPIAKLIDQAKHCSILYDYRNHLIHEFRQPGDLPGGVDCPLESWLEECPCYTTNWRGERFSWELVYPVGFLRSLAGTVLQAVCAYCMVQGANPFEAYDWSSTWRRR
jgi:hypothetical protein